MSDNANEHEPGDDMEAEGVAPELETVEDAAVSEAERIIELEAEVASLKDQVLRQRAETENVRRRADKDKADGQAYGITKFARDILTVSDNLGRALQAVPDDAAESAKDFITGVELTERELLATLERHGVTRVEPEVGEKFDPNRHQAMFQVPTTDHPNGAVMQVVAPGYIIKDRLLRPAMVGVAQNDQSVDHVDTNA